MTCAALRNFAGRVEPQTVDVHLYDVSPGGALHCTGTALRCARLSELTDDTAFQGFALAWMASALIPQAFALIQTVEFIVSPREWGQWFLEDGALDNRSLFQPAGLPRSTVRGHSETPY